MADFRRELHVLISIAKIDVALNTVRKELTALPRQVEEIDTAIQTIEDRGAEAKAGVEHAVKERRMLEQELVDNSEKVKKYKMQLMEVKTNKEYTAMLHEIEHVQHDTDAKEERLLILMDELEKADGKRQTFTEEGARKKAELARDRGNLEQRINALRAEAAKLDAEKPKLLSELDPQIERRYARTLSKLHDFAVTHIVGETCQGCFTRLPPQLIVEVTRNDKLITCEACGRILVYYIA